MIILVGGTAASQALVLLALPFLTRLYTPEDFGVLAIYTALLAIISVVACLRFEIAIPIPKSDMHAINLLGLALICVGVVSLSAAAAVIFMPISTFTNGRLSQLAPYRWMLPIGILLAGTYGALRSWTTRRKAFGSIAKTRLSQSAVAMTTQGVLGVAGISPFGLLFGHMLQHGSGIFGLAHRLWKSDRNLIGTISIPRMRWVFFKYSNYPKFSTWEALANNAATQVPILIIGTLALGPEAGYLMLAMRAMQAPMALIGSAVRQVYLSRAGDELREGNLSVFTCSVLGGLMKSGVGPLIFAGAVAPLVFPLVFGDDWHRAGNLVSWMTPWFILQYLSSPLSMALYVTDNQRTALLLHIFGFLLRVSAVYISSRYFAAYLSEVYAVSSAIFYLIFLVVIAGVTRCKFRDLSIELKRSLPYIAVWIAFTGLVLLAFRLPSTFISHI